MIKDGNHIKEFMEDKEAQEVNEVVRTASIDKLFEDHHAIMIFYGERDSPKWNVFSSIAHDDNHENIAFVWTESANIQDKYQLEENNAYALTR